MVAPKDVNGILLFFHPRQPAQTLNRITQSNAIIFSIIDWRSAVKIIAVDTVTESQEAHHSHQKPSSSCNALAA